MMPPATAPPAAAKRPARPEPSGAPTGTDDQANAATAAYARADVARVIRSKIQPPPLRRSTLSRQRLLLQLRTSTERRVTLVVAEAGYGKTTLLTDFSARAYVRCLWYKLDSTDRDAVTLVNYLIGAGREIKPEFGAVTALLLAQIPAGQVAVEAVVASLLGELQEFDDAPTVLILDDFHTIDDSPAAADLVSRLVRDAPPLFRFVISSRRRLPVPLARLAGMGELAEISTEDLRFSRDETHQLFAESYGQPLDPDVLTQLDARTRGWAASLQMLYSSIRGRPAGTARSLARALSGASSPVYDFLAEEVIGHLAPELESFLVRAAVLDAITPDRVMALFGPDDPMPSRQEAQEWIARADNLGLLSKGSQTSEARQFHPLLRDFLQRQLSERLSSDEVRQMHGRIARVAEATDPLVAAHHFIEAGLAGEAMRCVGQSVVLTMGSGRWGAASQLIGQLSGVPAEPALVAIQARRLFEEGDIAGAAALLAGTDASDAPAPVRAVLRQTRLSMGWRSGDSTSLSQTLQEIGEDPETPGLLRDIAQVFVDSSPSSAAPAPFPQLAKRLERMAEAQAQAGYDYYAAISLHNAAIALVSSGRFEDALETAQAALMAFARITPGLAASRSTHAVIAACEFELGRVAVGHEEIALAVSSGDADGDVHAACAFALAVIGHNDEALRQLAEADRLEREGRSDIAGGMIAGFTRALSQLPRQPQAALSVLAAMPKEVPLDLELHLQHLSLLSVATLLSGHTDEAGRIASDGLAAAKQRGGRRFEVRLNLILPLAGHDGRALARAIQEAAAVGEMALLETADAIGQSLFLMPSLPTELTRSIEMWPSRWLPVLRRTLASGDTPGARTAAKILDDHGTVEDISLLRAYAKTYRKRPIIADLGRALARRTSPKLEIRDLGRTNLAVGARQVALSAIRRKPASLLMYLVTRPKFTATREQVLDELWPDTDPASAANSLNQSLYFLRREVDPWYEDGVSADYVCYEGEILWLDAELVRVASAEFVWRANATSLDNAHEVVAALDTYDGQFSPEFEYEEWAIAWRARVHAGFLNLSSAAIDALAMRAELAAAKAIAQHALAVDASAEDVEKKLVWLYWHSGATSAAAALYRRLETELKGEGIDLPSLKDLTARAHPP